MGGLSLFLGVDHFYIYDNGGKISSTTFLQDYLEKGVVKIFFYPTKGKQLDIYENCLENYRLLHQWIAFIDLDEFIAVKPPLPPPQSQPLPSPPPAALSYCSIPSILKEFEDYGGLTLSWMMFGSSGHVIKPKGGVISNYFQCFQYDHIKSIVNTNYVIKPNGEPHSFQYSHGKFAVDIDFMKTSSFVNKPRPSLFEIIWINHYH